MFLFILVVIAILVVLYYLFNTKSVINKELFIDSSNTDINILMFLSSGCGHCVTYKKNMHPQVKEFADSKGYKYEIVSESDGEKFSKYKIKYIPTCIIIKGNNHKVLIGEICIKNIEDTIKSM
jgi:thioredoxin-related protein